MAADELTKVNLLNVGLMASSCAAAYVFPLELFVFAYAVLGPLHYLTQISWLQKRTFFVQRRGDYMFLIVLCIAFAAGLLLNLRVPVALLLGVAFGSALAFSFLRKTTHKIVVISLIIVFSVLSRRLPAYGLILGIFLPTIIHVYVFTGLFILYGALKSRSRSGYASLFVFLGCGVIFFVFNPALSGVADSAYFRAGYRPFEGMTLKLSQLLGLADVTAERDIYEVQSGVALLRFVAFAYTYHYLNWFSKTSVIKWHDVSRLRLGAIVALWIFSIVIYAVDFRTGFIVLFALSISHVVLEFPLNHQTIRGIGGELKKRVWAKAAPPREEGLLSPNGL